MTKIDPDAKFLNDEDIDGVELVMDFDLVKELQRRLGLFAHGPTNFFAANWPVSLSMDTIQQLKTSPYVASPKPAGIRYMLYIDADGDMLMENMSQHFFRLNEDRSIYLTVRDTVLDGIVVHRNVSDSECTTDGSETIGKLTFVIMDAIRCNGVDLTGRNILERIAFVKVLQNDIMPNF